MDTGKTSTFTIHHDRCKPENWTVSAIIAFRDFLRTGSMQHAAVLSRLGVQLVRSEHHEPKGGELEQIGWTDPEDKHGEIYDLEGLAEDDITSLCRVYRGPVEHVVKLTVGDGEGNFDGYEYEVKPTIAEAQAFLKSAHSEA